MTQRWHVYRMVDGQQAPPIVRFSFQSAINAAAWLGGEQAHWVKRRIPDRRSDRSGKYCTDADQGIWIERVE